MKSIAAFCLAILIASLALSLRGRAQDQALGEISGRVVLDETGKPLKNVEVRARGPGGDKDFYVPGVKLAYTDKEGYYTITGLRAGSYTLFVNKDGFVPLIDDIQVKPYEEGLEIPISQGESRRNINFRMVRGGVITGKITDIDGNPVIGQLITPFPKRDDGSYRQFQFALEPRFTDDRGIYRIYGLPAGKYVIGTNQSQRRGYGVVYYPGVRSLAKAKILEVSAGQELTDIDFSLGRLSKGYSISGKVVTGDGAPVSNVRILARAEVNSASFNSNPSDAQGSFTIQGVEPDVYNLQLNPNYNQANLVSESKKVVVDSADVTGLVLKVQQGATISGLIEIEDGGKLERVDLMAIDAISLTDDGSPGPRQASARIGSDYTFTIVGVPNGRVRLRVVIKDHRYYLKSIVSAEGDISNFPLEVAPGATLSGIRILLTPGAAVLSGTVSAMGDRKGVKGSVVYAVPEELEQRMLGELIRTAAVDPWGRYLLSGLAPGRYLVFVRHRGELSKLEDLIISHQADAVVVSVKAGESKALNLTLNQ